MAKLGPVVPFTTSPVYLFAHAALPCWAAGFLPAPRGTDVAPVPKQMTPAVMKKALLTLSTPDKLVGLPDKTANLLIFNNATA
ncbi:hypothetical protein C8R44DRAFT_876407 [Mycena epipterygia]|nr:hypothetical protein C8R44DRAFT_876407 [Mycena epipterygia]